MSRAAQPSANSCGLIRLAARLPFARLTAAQLPLSPDWAWPMVSAQTAPIQPAYVFSVLCEFV